MIFCSKTLAEDQKLRGDTADDIKRRYNRMSGDDQEPWLLIVCLHNPGGGCPQVAERK